MYRRLNLFGSGLHDRVLVLLFSLTFGATVRAQDPLATLPKNYNLALDNSAVSVIRVHYGPHEKVPVHDHPSHPTVFVYLSDSGPLRIDHAGEGEKETSVTRPPTTRGAFRVTAGMAERHSIENLGDTSADFLRVELKQVSLDLKEPFRGKAPQNQGENLDALEFTDIGLQIETIICAGPAACPIKSSSVPSLIVAFTPFAISPGASEKGEKLSAGTVHWLSSSELVTMTPESGSPAHLLRILLPATKK